MIPVTLIEPWRGDFVSMIVHHFITSGLIISSYSMNCLKIGTAVLAEQDFADIFLPLAKMCKYAKIPTVGDFVFVLFVLAWIPTRHGVFFYICGCTSVLYNMRRSLRLLLRHVILHL